jgi:transcriptional regulator with XRE-family HTH domain
MMATTRRDAWAVEFGKWLRGTRESHRLSKDELVRRSGVSKTTVTELENGHFRHPLPSLDTFLGISRGLDVELGYVLHKAGLPVGLGVNMERLEHVEQTMELLDVAEHEIRKAMAEAIERFGGPVPAARDLAQALAAFDLVVERLRAGRKVTK